MVADPGGPMRQDTPGVQSKMFQKLQIFVALVLWMGGFHINMFLSLICFLYFPRPWAIVLFVFQMTQILIPIDENSSWGLALARWISKVAPQHFPIKVKLENKHAIDPSRPYVVGVEPHSVLPLGAMVFSQVADFMPWKNVKVLASSAVYYVPFVRHLWSWFGMASVSRKKFTRLLNNGTTCVLVPGGARECLFMQHNKEVIFLRKRRGFVRMAMSAGAPLVPAFIFGQHRTYNWWRPKGEWFEDLAHVLRFSPLVFWGMYRTPLPFPQPMLVVVGKPIPVDKVENPTDEQVNALLSKFISEMAALHERHKEEGGDENMELVIE